MTSLRLVLDTNVLLSALLFPDGHLSWMRQSWRSRHCVPLASRLTTTELLRVLTYPKFGLDAEEREHLLADYLPWCEPVTVSQPPTVPECRDPFDRPFLELALYANADALVTGDNDLLSLASVFSIPILTANELKDRLATRETFGREARPPRSGSDPGP